MTQPIFTVTTTLPNQPAKAYAEVHVDSISSNNTLSIGLGPAPGYLGYSLRQDGTLFPSGSGVAFNPGDVLCIAYDQGGGNLWLGVNVSSNGWIGGGSPAAGSSPSFSGLAGACYVSAQVGGFSASGAGGVTLRARAADFSQGLPAGFASWSGT